MTDPTSREGAASTEAGIDEASLAQVSVYLLRQIGEWEDALRTTDDLERHELDPAVGLDGVLYVARRGVTQPRWLPFVRSITGAEITAPRSTRLSAVLFVRRGEERFAITFGYGRHLLDHEVVEADYGLKVAAGLVNADAIAGADTRSVQASALQVRRVSSRAAGMAAMGFDARREILRAISGRLDDETLGTRISGSASVALTGERDASSLGQTLDRLLDAYNARRYLERFRHIGRWEVVTAPDVRSRLDNEVLAVLTRMYDRNVQEARAAGLPGGREPHLEAPEVIDWRASGFRTSIEPAQTVHAFPDLDAYLRATRRAPRLVDLRRNHRLELISDESDEVVASWPVYAGLNWELDFDGDYYILAEGKWSRVDAAYRQEIDESVADIPLAELARPDYDPVEWEVDYNLRLAAEAADRVCLDRKQAPFEGESGTVEPADVLTGAGQFVHVKKDDGAADLSHLFMQAAVSASLFLRSREFRDHLRAFVANTALEASVPHGRPDPAGYEVVLAIISTRADPVVAALPFLARHSLAQVKADIEAIGFRLTQARIPIRIGARPADAGPLWRDEHRRDRAAPRQRRRGRRAAVVAELAEN